MDIVVEIFLTSSLETSKEIMAILNIVIDIQDDWISIMYDCLMAKLGRLLASQKHINNSFLLSIRNLYW